MSDMSRGYGVPSGDGRGQPDYSAIEAAQKRIQELEDALHDAQNRAQVAYSEGVTSVRARSQEEEERNSRTAAALADLPENASGADVVRALKRAGL